MPSIPRLSALAAICALALVVPAGAADDLLPPEPTMGEWLQDTLADASLWFAESGNLEFADLTPELSDYPLGRRWVHVIDGQPAWVTYYVPGEILGFEVDTHHDGALATEFHFAAGSTWRDLQPVDATSEEITGYEATWMRLYRANNELPAGTQFLRIEFPTGGDASAARLTEVWLRCRFGSAARSPFEPAEAFISQQTTDADSAAAAVPPPAPSAPAEVVVAPETSVEPIVVTAIVLDPPPPSPPAPIFAATAVDVSPPAINVIVPPRLTRVDFLADDAPLSEPPGVTLESRGFLADLADLLRRAF